MDNNYFSTITRLQEVRAEKLRLEEIEEELSKPILSDLNMIEELYSVFSENSCRISSSDKATRRSVFISIITRLYSPASLAEKPMNRGVRDELSRVLGVSKSLISNTLQSVRFLYQTYNDYRKDVDYLYNEILNYLRNKQLI